MGRKRKRALEKQQKQNQKRRYGPRSHKDKSVVPKGAQQCDKTQYRKNKKASNSAFSPSAQVNW